MWISIDLGIVSRFFVHVICDLSFLDKLRMFNETGFDVLYFSGMAYLLLHLTCHDHLRRCQEKRIFTFTRSWLPCPSGFSRVRIYHNFCRDTELIHYPFQDRVSFISRLGYTSRSYRTSLLHIFQNKQYIRIHILISRFSPILTTTIAICMYNCHLTLNCASIASLLRIHYVPNKL